MVLGAMDLPSSISPTPTTKPLLPNPSPLLKHPPAPAGASAAGVVYRECLKNHAASIGGHALDGCGEFMASPGAVASDPTSLKCAACGCHRNFHRRRHSPGEQLLLLRSPSPRSPSPGPTPSPQSPPPVSQLPPAQMLLALGGGESAHARKRFRTKFSPEQKEKMWAFAERVGWKMQRSDEKLVERFCSDIGVRRGVLKVWMHNNKHSLAKTVTHRPPLANNDNHNNVVAGPNSNSNDNDNDDDDDEEEHSKSNNLNNFFANNGSSSSS